MPSQLRVALRLSLYQIKRGHTEFSLNSNEEEVLSSENSWSDNITLGIANLLLWFVYISLILMILSGTWWALTARGFWSWVTAFIGVCFYGMWLGRYWGYGACLILFAVMFSTVKLFLSRRSKVVPNAKISKKMKRLLRNDK